MFLQLFKIERTIIKHWENYQTVIQAELESEEAECVIKNLEQQEWMYRRCAERYGSKKGDLSCNKVWEWFYWREICPLRKTGKDHAAVWKLASKSLNRLYWSVSGTLAGSKCPAWRNDRCTQWTEKTREDPACRSIQFYDWTDPGSTKILWDRSVSAAIFHGCTGIWTTDSLGSRPGNGSDDVRFTGRRNPHRGLSNHLFQPA